MIENEHLIACRLDFATLCIVLCRIELSRGVRERSTRLPMPDLPGPLDAADLHIELRFLRCASVYRLYWQVRSLPSGGAPPQSLDPAHAGPLAGRYDISADRLELLARHQEDGFAAGRDEATQGEQLARQAGGFVYRQGGVLRNAPWSGASGMLYLRAEHFPPSGPASLAIARADAPDHAAVARLAADDPGTLLPELSLDGRHLALVRGAGPDGVATWRIHDAQSGRPIGKIDHSEGFGSFRVIGDRLFCLDEVRNAGEDYIVRVERTLRAFQLATGASLWSYPLDILEEPDPRFPPP